jgi:hypothetical protein
VTRNPRTLPKGWTGRRPQHPPRGGWTRHLLYYVYPRRGNGAWQRNVEQLLERIDLFNGRRVVAVATDGGSDHAETVRAAFAGRDVEFVELANNPAAGESAAFGPLWEAVEKYRGPGDVTFYAHAKGIRYDDPRASPHLWATLLYATNLDYWPLVEREFLSHKRMVGTLQTGSHGHANWIYAGTFFWFRNAPTFEQKWRRCRLRYGGVELWPGKVFPPYRSCGCLFHELPPHGTPYDAIYAADLAEKFTVWSDANAAHRRAGALRDPWLPRYDRMAHPEQTAFIAGVRACLPEHFTGKRVVEIGSRDVNGTVRDYFDGCDYTGLDAVAGPGVDVVGLAHEYRLPGPVDVVVTCEALEHDPRWRLTLATACGWLRPGGLFVGTWAGPLRPEHGTTRTGAEYGPDADYYGNVSAADFRTAAAPYLDGLQVVTARGGQDVYAVGFRR